MKKAVGAGVLLALMLALALWSAHHLDSAVEEMLSHAELCRAYCASGDTESADAELSAARARWKQNEGFARVFLRHSAAEAVEDALYEARRCLRAGDIHAAQAALDWLEDRLSALAYMEHIRWGSVF